MAKQLIKDIQYAASIEDYIILVLITGKHTLLMSRAAASMNPPVSKTVPHTEPPSHCEPGDTDTVCLSVFAFKTSQHVTSLKDIK